MADKILPEYVRLCPLCEGTGETPQTYNRGGGMGTMRLRGSCQICGKYTSFGRPGAGYIYHATNEPVGQSVLAQLKSLEIIP